MNSVKNKEELFYNRAVFSGVINFVEDKQVV